MAKSEVAWVLLQQDGKQEVGQEFVVGYIADCGAVSLAISRGALAVSWEGVFRLAQAGLGTRRDPLERIEGLPGEELKFLSRSQRGRLLEIRYSERRNDPQDALVAFL